MSDLETILNKIDEVDNFPNYTEFRLNKKLNMSDVNMQKIIYDLNKNPNIYAFYNGHTQRCDIIGVLDIEDRRYYDFDDDIWCLSNKGICVSTKKTIYD